MAGLSGSSTFTSRPKWLLNTSRRCAPQQSTRLRRSSTADRINKSYWPLLNEAQMHAAAPISRFPPQPLRVVVSEKSIVLSCGLKVGLCSPIDMEAYPFRVVDLSINSPLHSPQAVPTGV